MLVLWVNDLRPADFQSKSYGQTFTSIKFCGNAERGRPDVALIYTPHWTRTERLRRKENMWSVVNTDLYIRRTSLVAPDPTLHRGSSYAATKRQELRSTMINYLVLPCLVNDCRSSSAQYQSVLLLTHSHVTGSSMERLIIMSICGGKTWHTPRCLIHSNLVPWNSPSVDSVTR